MSVQVDAATIAQATGGRLVADGPSGRVCTDTRALRPGDWFLALVGERFDGHDYLSTAAEAGAVGCVVQRDVDGWAGGCVRVDDTLRALQDLGRHARSTFGGPVVGLTGSSGKTTTRALIALAVSARGPVHQTQGNLNNHIGVPLTLLDLGSNAATAVIEMGTSGPGEIAVLADIATPDVRLIVNVGPAHLEELGGLEGVAREKGALFRSARPGDVICVNVDDPFLAPMPLPAGTERVEWGSRGAIALVDARIDGATLSTTATWETPTGRISARIPAPGHHIAHNAAGALACAHALGVDLHDAAAALEDYQPVGMRLRSEALPSGAIALNDAYNANPASTAASLRLLASLPGRRAAVLGDMLELGTDEARYHAETATLAHELGLDLVVLVGPRMAAAADACPGALSFADPLDAVDPLRGWLRSGDHVLLKGSRGARVERVLQGLVAEEEG